MADGAWFPPAFFFVVARIGPAGYAQQAPRTQIDHD
jgi:hypothetical protein